MTCVAGNDRGSSLSRQPATPGTAATSGAGINPWMCRNRSSARSAVTYALADQVLELAALCSSTNPATVAASSPASASRGEAGSHPRNVLAWLR